MANQAQGENIIKIENGFEIVKSPKMAITTKDQFYNNLEKMLDICMFAEEKLTDGEILTIANNTKDNYKLALELINENQRLKDKINELNRFSNEITNNAYFKKYKKSKKHRMLTLEEKASSPHYHNCPYCDNIVKDNYINKHFTTDCCSSNQLKKEMSKKSYPVHSLYNKPTQLMNLYIRLCLYDTSPKNNKRNGSYWKYQELMKIYDSMKV